MNEDEGGDFRVIDRHLDPNPLTPVPVKPSPPSNPVPIGQLKTKTELKPEDFEVQKVNSKKSLKKDKKKKSDRKNEEIRMLKERLAKLQGEVQEESDDNEGYRGPDLVYDSSRKGLLNQGRVSSRQSTRSFGQFMDSKVQQMN